MDKNVKPELEQWISSMAKENEIPEEIEGLYFGMYEDADGGFCVYLSGAEEYDEADSDWACDMDYEPEDNAIVFSGEEWSPDDWEEFQTKVAEALKEILASNDETIGNFIGDRHVSTGFYDGDLINLR